MDKNLISKLLNEGRTSQWNLYRKKHPEWTPDLRGLKLDSEKFNHGLEDSFMTENFNIKAAIYDLTTEFYFDFRPKEHGLVYEEKSSDSAKVKSDSQADNFCELDVFISHSNEDNAFVQALIDLMRFALNIDSKKIRCSSVSGYRLPTGADTNEQLRKEVYDTKVLIGVITLSSMKSAYVLFELGARWGADKKVLPILACGADSSVLGGPLTGINSLSCDNSADIHQLIDDVAIELGIKKQKIASFQSKIEKLVEISAQNNAEGLEKNQLSEREDTFRIFKSQFLTFVRRFEADWISERDSNPNDFEDGLYIADNACSEVLDFRADVVKDDDSGIIMIFDEAAKRLKLLKRYEVHLYDHFWQEGLHIIDLLKGIPNAIDNYLDKTRDSNI